MLKIKLCKEKKLNLIVIPYNVDILKFIIKECTRLNYDFNKNQIINGFKQKAKAEEIKEILQDYTATLIKTFIKNQKSGNRWFACIKCINNHIFETAISHLKKGRWCNICTHKKEYRNQRTAKILKNTEKSEINSKKYDKKIYCKFCNCLIHPRTKNQHIKTKKHKRNLLNFTKLITNFSFNNKKN